MNRKFVEIIAFALILILTNSSISAINVKNSSYSTEKLVFLSPSNNVKAIFEIIEGQLTYSLHLNETLVLQESSLGINVNDIDLGYNVYYSSPTMTTVYEEYSSLGAKSQTINRFNNYELNIEQIDTSVVYTLEVRMYDDGIAYRYKIPGAGTQLVKGEASSWRLPENSIVWYQTNTVNYEGEYCKKNVEDILIGTDIGAPLTYKLVDGSYASITEGALYNYSGMSLKYEGERIFKAEFLDGQSYGGLEPYDGAWAIQGDIVTPWRITMTSQDLNGLVNCDIVQNVNPPPDPDIDWSFVKPGRSLWSWYHYGQLFPWSYTVENKYIDYAKDLGFEYTLFDNGWQTIPEQQFNEMLSNAKNQNIAVWLWKSWVSLGTDSLRNNFFSWCKQKGIVGVKIDFIRDESKEMVEFYEDTLKTAAEYGLMINFHGANKPTGLERTYPNEMTREGIKGLEQKRLDPNCIQNGHDSALAFTRLLAGHADYTPVTFNPVRIGDTSWAHQLANAIMFISQVTHWAGYPPNYFEKDSRVVDIIKTIPAVWDETVVMSGSEIMDAAGIARRSGDTWFIGIVNDEEACNFKINFSFLCPNVKYDSIIIKDLTDTNAGCEVLQESLSKNDELYVYLRGEGGFVAKITPSNNENMPPQTPSKPDVVKKGSIGQEYTFYATTVDYDDDQIYYMFDWGDGNVSEWIGPFASGETCEIDHVWKQKNNYLIKVKAKDEHDAESDWSEASSISISKSKQLEKQRFFEIKKLFYSILTLIDN